jgi:CRP/FNR family cyclic AMP-dependent transcriptional regulator
VVVSATVEACSDLVADTLRANDIMACLENSPALGTWLAGAQSVLECAPPHRSVFELCALNVSRRIRCELLRLADKGKRSSEGMVVACAPTREELADRVGAHREAVTRELMYLSKADIIR